MKSRYSISLGIGIVIGLLFVENLIIWDDPSVTTDLSIFILLLGGYIATYTSNIGKARVALISGIGVSVVLIAYQIFNNKTLITSSVDLISFLIIPGTVMLIGGFIAKFTKKGIKNLLRKNKRL